MVATLSEGVGNALDGQQDAPLEAQVRAAQSALAEFIRTRPLHARSPGPQVIYSPARDRSVMQSSDRLRDTAVLQQCGR